MRQNARVYNGNGNGETANRQISNVSDIYTQFDMEFTEAAEVSVCVCAHVCTCVCMEAEVWYVCMHVCMYVCVCVRDMY